MRHERGAITHRSVSFRDKTMVERIRHWVIGRRILMSLAVSAFTLMPGCAVRWQAQGAQTMNPQISQVRGFTVVGITGRTNNAKEMTAEGVIGTLWSRLMQEDLLAKIPNREDENIVAVYTDYASDHNGDYTYTLGAKVTRDSEVPVGMVATKVLNGKYAVFTTERGPANRVVPEIWQKINSLPKTAPGGDRTYKSDFEVYDQRARNPQDAIVDVFVGIR
jgi:predicted transcriptional regulator YdeE